MAGASSRSTPAEPPFDNLDVRKAVIAGFNRVAARQQRGGEALGPIAQHLHPAGHGRVRGVQRRRGLGRRDGLAADARGRPRRSPAEYFKKAGYASGKYEGGEEVLIVGDNADPDKSIAQITEQQLNEMGFKTKLRLVTRNTMFTKFCGVPDSGVNVCPSVGWAQDFADAQTMLDPTFNGENIIPARQRRTGPSSTCPEVNKAIDDAKLVTDPAERAQAWADANKLIVEAGAVDPVHVGLPDRRRLAQRARRAERLQHDLGLELHVHQVETRSPIHRHGRPAAARPAGRPPRSSAHGPLHRHAASPAWCCC